MSADGSGGGTGRGTDTGSLFDRATGAQAYADVINAIVSAAR